jgi:hypothetical protein
MAKCLSLKQPYSELIVSGRKTIELRKWNTKYRGRFLIHVFPEAPKTNKNSFILSPASFKAWNGVNAVTGRLAARSQSCHLVF